MVLLTTFSVFHFVFISINFSFLVGLQNFITFLVQLISLLHHNFHHALFAELVLLRQVSVVELLQFLLFGAELLPEFIVAFSLLLDFSQLLHVLRRKSLGGVLSLFGKTGHFENTWELETEIVSVILVVFQIYKLLHLESLQLFLGCLAGTFDFLFYRVERIPYGLCLPWRSLIVLLLRVCLRINNGSITSYKIMLWLVLNLDIRTSLWLWVLLILLHLHLSSHFFWNWGLSIEPTVNISDDTKQVGAIVIDIPVIQKAITYYFALRMNIIMHHPGKNHHIWLRMRKLVSAVDPDKQWRLTNSKLDRHSILDHRAVGSLLM